MRAAGSIKAIRALVLAVLAIPSMALAQPCDPRWAEELSCLGGIDGPVYASVFWDDGSGEKLVVGGWFAVAGCAPAANVAMWDGQRWHALGGGTDGPVYALEVFDDGSGPVLYAGGNFDQAGGQDADQIARWDGASWSPMGRGVEGCSGSFCTTEVLAMEVFDDGGGARLYVGGNFTRAGDDRQARFLAAWDGGAWSSVDGGAPFADMSGVLVYELEVLDDGAGPRLFVGGRFDTVAGQPAENIVAWDGAAWDAIGDGTPLLGDVHALRWHDDGSGGALYVGGDMRLDLPSGQAYGVLAWDGVEWSTVGEGFKEQASEIEDLIIMDIDGVPALVAGGDFETLGAEPAEHLAAWDGERWRPMGPTIDDCCLGTSVVETLAHSWGPPDGLLFVGGDFEYIQDDRIEHVGAWDGTSWGTLGEGFEHWTTAVAYFEFDGQGTWYTMAAVGQSRLQYELLRWNGSAFERTGVLADGPAVPTAVFDDGSGPSLYFTGDFQTIAGVPANRIARWDGHTWSAVGTGFNREVRVATTVSWEGRDRLLALGFFSQTGDGRVARGLAEWDGARWIEFGGGIETGSSNFVDDAIVFEDADGVGLFVGGRFDRIGGVAAQGLARWDGVQWSTVGGLGASATDLEVFRVGDEPALFISGLIGFDGIAAWTAGGFADIGDGATGCPGGCRSSVSVLTVFDDGTGEKLYAGGHYLGMDRVEGTAYIAAWDGSRWNALPGDGLDGWALVLERIDTAAGPALFVSGDFTLAGGLGSARAALLQGCPVCPADLDGDGSLTIFDFLAFGNLFDLADPRADFDGDGAFTIFDFLAFQNAFDAGCA